MTRTKNAARRSKNRSKNNRNNNNNNNTNTNTTITNNNSDTTIIDYLNPAPPEIVQLLKSATHEQLVDIISSVWNPLFNDTLVTYLECTPTPLTEAALYEFRHGKKPNPKQEPKQRVDNRPNGGYFEDKVKGLIQADRERHGLDPETGELLAISKGSKHYDSAVPVPNKKRKIQALEPSRNTNGTPSVPQDEETFEQMVQRAKETGTKIPPLPLLDGTPAPVKKYGAWGEPLGGSFKKQHREGDRLSQYTRESSEDSKSTYHHLRDPDEDSSQIGKFDDVEGCSNCGELKWREGNKCGPCDVEKLEPCGFCGLRECVGNTYCEMCEDRLVDGQVVPIAVV